MSGVAEKAFGFRLKVSSEGHESTNRPDVPLNITGSIYEGKESLSWHDEMRFKGLRKFLKFIDGPDRRLFRLFTLTLIDQYHGNPKYFTRG